MTAMMMERDHHCGRVIGAVPACGSAIDLHTTSNTPGASLCVCLVVWGIDAATTYFHSPSLPLVPGPSVALSSSLDSLVIAVDPSTSVVLGTSLAKVPGVNNDVDEDDDEDANDMEEVRAMLVD